MIKKVITCLLIAGIIMIVNTGAHAGDNARKRSFPFDVPFFSEAFADNGKYHYGGSKKGKYGERRDVVTESEAQTIMKEYFPNNDYKVGKIKKKNLYFEADIIDKKGNVIDRVIIDKRTGRIRSVY